MTTAAPHRLSDAEARRLRARAARLRRAIAALEDPRVFPEEPGALRQAIDAFRAELASLERRVGDAGAS